MTKERIMLIVWKWRDLERNNCVVDRELLRTSKYANIHQHIDRAKDQLFNEYIVHEKLPDGRTELYTPVSRVVRTFIVKTIYAEEESHECIKFLDALIEYYSEKGADLMVFLHRRDGFVQVDVETLINKHSLKGCFLIGDGRDHIYYRPERKQGLISDDGRFYSKQPEPRIGQPAVRVADNAKKIVYARYFNHVWTYYQHEFFIKIFEYREDLISHFYKLLNDRVPIAAAELSRHLKKNRALHLRTISFIENDCCQLTEAEQKELDVFGKAEAKAYEFDDLKGNLHRHKDITAEYSNVSTLLHRTLLHESEDELAGVNQWLRELDEKFMVLLDALKHGKA